MDPDGIRHMPPGARKLLSAVLAAIFALIVYASFAPAARLWGIDHLAYIPLPLRILLLLAIGATFHPRIAIGFCRGVEFLLGGLVFPAKRRKLVLGLVFVLCFAVFSVLSVSVPILGDAQLVVATVNKVTANQKVPFVTNTLNTLKKQHIAPGTTLIYILLSKVSYVNLGIPVSTTIRILSALLGAVFISVLFAFIGGAVKELSLRAYVLVFVVFAGTTELFFGYIENYTPLFLVAFLYLIASFRFLRKGRTIRAPALLLALAMLLHVEGVLLVPSFVFLLIVRFVRGKDDRLFSYLAMGTAIVTVGAFAAGYTVDKISRFYLPLLGTESKPGMFSLRHMLDLINEWFIILPTLFFFLTMWLVARFSAGLEEESPGRRKHPRDRNVQPAPAVRGAESRREHSAEERKNGETYRYFCFFIALPSLLFLIVFDPVLGMGRDWDLLGLATVGFMPLMIMILKDSHRRVRHQDAFRRLIAPALAINMVMASSWVVINKSESLSIARFENILALDEEYAAYGYENLFIYFREQRQYASAARILEKAIALSPNPRYYHNLGGMYLLMGDTLSAIAGYKQALAKDPSFKPARLRLITMFNKTGRFKELAEVCKEAIAVDPSDPVYHYLLGKSYVYTGRVKEGVEILLYCKSLKPPKAIVRRIDKLLKRIRVEIVPRQ